MKEQELPCAADCIFERKCAEQLEKNGKDSCTTKAVGGILGKEPSLVRTKLGLVDAYAMLEDTLEIIHIRDGVYFKRQV